MKELREDIENIVDKVIEEYMVEKEYKEFVIKKWGGMVAAINPDRTSIEEGDDEIGPLTIVNLIPKSDASLVLKLEKNIK